MTSAQSPASTAGRRVGVRARTQACSAMPDATPALIDRVDPNIVMEQTIDGGAACVVGQSPGPPGRTRAGCGGAATPTRAAPSRPGCRCRPPRGRRRPRGRPAPRSSRWCSTWRYRSVTIAPRRFQRRRPTMCTRRTPNAFALRTTVPMLKSCSQFSIATSTGNGSRPGPPGSPRRSSTGSGRRRCAGRRARAAPGSSRSSSGHGQRVRTDPDAVRLRDRIGARPDPCRVVAHGCGP